jgi:glycosyltransferase
VVKITVITAVFNAEKTIAQAIESVQSQTYENIEHIIIDGASTDKTLEIIKDLSAKRSRIISEPDSGIYEALNKGIALSTGDVIGFLHSDDVYGSKDILQLIADHFKDSSVSGVFGNLNYIRNDKLGSIARRWRALKIRGQDGAKEHDFQKKIINGWMPPHPTLYMRRNCYADKGCSFNVNYKISADYLSILNAFMNRQNKFIYLDKTLINMRVGGISNKGLNNLVTKTYEDYLALREYKFCKFSAIKIVFLKNIRKIGQLRLKIVRNRF